MAAVEGLALRIEGNTAVLLVKRLPISPGLSLALSESTTTNRTTKNYDIKSDRGKFTFLVPYQAWRMELQVAKIGNYGVKYTNAGHGSK